MSALMINLAAVPEDFEQAKAYLDAAKTPAERNARKMQLHARFYSTGPQKLLGLRGLGSVLYSSPTGKQDGTEKS